MSTNSVHSGKSAFFKNKTRINYLDINSRMKLTKFKTITVLNQK